MVTDFDPVISLLPHRNNPDRFYNELETLLREQNNDRSIILYRPKIPEEVPFNPSPTVQAIPLAGEHSPPEKPDLNAILYREHGLAKEENQLYHLQNDDQWYASIEGPQDFLTGLKSNQEHFLQVFEVLSEQIAGQQYSQPGGWISDVRNLVETHDEQEEFFKSLVDFTVENLSVDQAGLYAPSNKHYTLQAHQGFEPEERISRKFFPRDKLQPQKEEQNYLLERDDETGRKNLFIPLNVGPQREGLLILFEYLPEGEALDEPDQSLVETLQDLLSFVLAAHRSAFGTKSEYIVDELTSLRTEKYFRKRLEEETERGERYGPELSLVVLEIDNLENIKKDYGENLKQEALRKLAHLIKNSFRFVDVACRFQNNQFGIIYPNTPIGGALTAAQRFDQLVEKLSLTIGNTEIPISIDGGLASFPEDGETPDEIIKQARLALYEAKQSDEATLVSSHEINEGPTQSL